MKLSSLIKEKALITGGEYMLSSRTISDYYIDLSRLMLTSNGLQAICHELIDKFAGSWMRVDAIGGPATGAIPLISGILMTLADSGYEKRGFFLRKQLKANAPSGFDCWDGDLRPNDKVILLEDVTTTGNTLLNCAVEAQNKGCQIVDIISIIDRGGVAHKFKEKKLPFSYLFTGDEILNA